GRSAGARPCLGRGARAGSRLTRAAPSSCEAGVLELRCEPHSGANPPECVVPLALFQAAPGVFCCLGIAPGICWNYTPVHVVSQCQHWTYGKLLMAFGGSNVSPECLWIAPGRYRGVRAGDKVLLCRPHSDGPTKRLD